LAKRKPAYQYEQHYQLYGIWGTRAAVFLKHNLRKITEGLQVQCARPKYGRPVYRSNERVIMRMRNSLLLKNIPVRI
jgi:hypothetical protein